VLRDRERTPHRHHGCGLFHEFGQIAAPGTHLAREKGVQEEMAQMANRRDGAAARVRSDFPAENATVQAAVAKPVAHSTTGTYNAIEATFFKKGDLGIVEPPVYLPGNPVVLPLIGVLFLAGLTVLVLS
jgi:hypothetical protein